MTIPKIDAHFANLARDISSEPADRARAVYVNRQLVDQFGAKFGMSESQAKAAVDEEMSKRYAPNPWDAPAPRRLKQQQRISKVDRMKGEQSTGLVGGSRYSEEQWDLFECRLGYR